MPQQTSLQADEAVQFVSLPELEHAGMFFRRAPAGAGRVQLDGVPGSRDQGQVFAAVGAGGGLEQIALVQIGPQGAQAGGRGLVGQHKARGAGQLGQKAAFAARAGADVQHGFPRPGGQRQGRQHGGAVLDVDIPEKGRQGTAQRPGLAAEAAAERGKGLGFEFVALGAQQGFHQGGVSGFADQTEGAGVLFGHDAPSIGQIRGKVSRIQAPACGGRRFHIARRPKSAYTATIWRGWSFAAPPKKTPRSTG